MVSRTTRKQERLYVAQDILEAVEETRRRVSKSLDRGSCRTSCWLPMPAESRWLGGASLRSGGGAEPRYLDTLRYDRGSEDSLTRGPTCGVAAYQGVAGEVVAPSGCGVWYDRGLPGCSGAERQVAARR